MADIRKERVTYSWGDPTVALAKEGELSLEKFKELLEKNEIHSITISLLAQEDLLTPKQLILYFGEYLSSKKQIFRSFGTISDCLRPGALVDAITQSQLGILMATNEKLYSRKISNLGEYERVDDATKRIMFDKGWEISGIQLAKMPQVRRSR